jgi:hypothetical protein
MALSAGYLREAYTREVVAVMQQNPKSTNFLRSFFKSTVAPTKFVSVDVQRMGEPVAVDILRGSDGTKYSFGNSTNKSFLPPYWKPYFNATELDVYDTVLGSNSFDNAYVFKQLIDQTALNLDRLKQSIERAKELQIAQIFDTGVVTLQAGDSIDFKRKSGSKVDPGSGNYWTTGATDVFAQIEAGCQFIRKNTNNNTPIFNLIMDSYSLDALLKNTTFLTRQNLFHAAWDNVTGPQRDASTGANFHGTISAGAYKVQLWSYDQYYTNSSGTKVGYLPAKKAILVPVDADFVLAHAMVPQLIKPNQPIPAPSEYFVKEYMDERATGHFFSIESAALAIPVDVDAIYTLKTVA